MDLNRLAIILKPYPAYRLEQSEKAIFKDLIGSWEEAKGLPKDMLTLLQKECPLEIKAQVKDSEDRETSKAKIIFGKESVEAVLMKHKNGRNTVCVSSQVGCPLNCAFCATGKLGFKRNLLASEIVSQTILFARYLKKTGEKITNVVFMGMGEPFLNYNEVMKAIRIINNKDKLNIGARKISISTVGITEGIKKLIKEPLQVNLAISLHAPNDELRSRLIPSNKKYPIAKILGGVREYIKKTRRRVMIEYLMLKDVNDSPQEAKELAGLLKNYLGGLFFVNLISFNPTGLYQPSSSEKIKRFKGILEKQKISVVERHKFGRDIKAACGQLMAKEK